MVSADGKLQRPGSAASVAERIKSVLIERPPAVGQPLPSYRELAGNLMSSVYAVQKAMEILEREGIVQRMERRGAFLRATSAPTRRAQTASKLKCVNVIIAPGGNANVVSERGAQFNAGYTDALDHRDIRLRFALPPESGHWQDVLSPDHPIEEQGCVYHLSGPDVSALEWFHHPLVPIVMQAGVVYPSDWLPVPHHRVCGNKAGGAAKAVQHLLELGHRRIGFFGWASKEPPWGHPIHVGASAALTCAGLALEKENVEDFSTNYKEEALPHALEMLKRPRRPTAILADTDAVALALLEAARTLGIAVPEELSVVGVNDLAEAATVVPALTSLSLSWRQVARSAVELLIDVFDKPGLEFQSRMVECRLMARASTAPPLQRT